MALARHQVALLVLPAAPEVSAERVRAAWTRLSADGFVDGHLPGARSVLVEGTFRRALLDLPAAGAEEPPVRMVANRLGGFRVACPTCRVNLAAPFTAAVGPWRAARGPRAVTCPSCRAERPLEAVDAMPPVGFARGWIAFEEADALELHAEAHALLVASLGGVHLVLRRG